MTQPLAELVAARIRAAMAVREMSAADLGRRIGGVEETWVRRRIRGQYSITMSDLERIAAALDMTPAAFLEPDGVAA